MIEVEMTSVSTAAQRLHTMSQQVNEVADHCTKAAVSDDLLMSQRAGRRRRPALLDGPIATIAARLAQDARDLDLVAAEMDAMLRDFLTSQVDDMLWAITGPSGTWLSASGGGPGALRPPDTNDTLADGDVIWSQEREVKVKGGVGLGGHGSIIVTRQVIRDPKTGALTYRMIVREAVGVHYGFEKPGVKGVGPEFEAYVSGDLFVESTYDFDSLEEADDVHDRLLCSYGAAAVPVLGVVDEVLSAAGIADYTSLPEPNKVVVGGEAKGEAQAMWELGETEKGLGVSAGAKFEGKASYGVVYEKGKDGVQADLVKGSFQGEGGIELGRDLFPGVEATTTPKVVGAMGFEYENPAGDDVGKLTLTRESTIPGAKFVEAVEINLDKVPADKAEALGAALLQGDTQTAGTMLNEIRAVEGAITVKEPEVWYGGKEEIGFSGVVVGAEGSSATFYRDPPPAHGTPVPAGTSTPASP